MIKFTEDQTHVDKKQKLQNNNDKLGGKNNSVKVNDPNNQQIGQNSSFKITVLSPVKNKCRLQVNDKYSCIYLIDWDILRKKSTLFQNMYEIYGDDSSNNQIVKIQLERPELFRPNLLEYFETGKFCYDMKTPAFTKYIGNATYLGMEELLNELQSTFWNCFLQNKQDIINMSFKSEVYYNFIEKFLREREKSQLSQEQQSNVLNFVVWWGMKYGLKDEQQLDLIKNFFKPEDLTAVQCRQFSAKFPTLFNLFVPAKTLVNNFLDVVTCKHCRRQVSKCEIGAQRCSRNYGHEA
eukprot:TRINITY_DN8243_c1_g3_i2.p1 TRINITY_DN8243_c1_g3~~TRINITY_DN8243_c1_g3_i2.p1  ORF type:complete len:294 (-),score=22.50 TRINITY_DN8243_c1_g3_i2:298-1179(-)